jgi:hypothetical protein
MDDIHDNTQGLGCGLLVVVIYCVVSCSSGQSVRLDADPAVTRDGPEITVDTRMPVDSKPEATWLDAPVRDAERRSDADAKARSPNRTCKLAEGDPSICQCVSGTLGTSDPPCTPDSIAPGPEEQGLCCNDSDGCECRGYKCVVISYNGACVCGPIGATWLPEGTTVSDCPASDDSWTCCFQKGMHQCTCGPSSCYGAREEVAACSVSSIKTCNLGETSVSSCS